MTDSFVQKPVLTLVVGVVGQRCLAPGMATEIERRLEESFAAIDKACKFELSRGGDFFALPSGADPLGYRVRLLTGFAEGGDWIAAKIAARMAWNVEAILPLPTQHYVKTFEAPTKAQLSAAQPPNQHDIDRLAASLEAAEIDLRAALENAGDRIVVLPSELRRGCAPTSGQLNFDAAFARQGAFLLRQIDLLVAIWDDADTNDRVELNEIVLKALERRIPVLWISAVEKRRPWLIATPLDLRPEAGHADALDGALDWAIEKAVRPPHERGGDAEYGASAHDRLVDFMAEELPSNHFWCVYRWVRGSFRLWSGFPLIKVGSLEQERQAWTPFLDVVFGERDRHPPLNANLPPDEKDFRAKIETILLPRYHFADQVATRYAHTYRSLYFIAYTLAFLAVAASWGSETLLGSNFLGHFLELMFILAVIAFVSFGLSGRWHQRWLDARALAEPLRHVRFLALMGETDVARGLESHLPEGAVWTAWYLRATIRELGLPFACYGAGHQKRVLRATRDYEMEEQISYNESNSETLKSMHEWLHFLGNLSFYVAAALLFIIVVPTSLGKLQLLGAGWERMLRDFEEPYRQTIEIVTALLPALGATLAGIRFTADFEDFSVRSGRTGKALEDLKSDYGVADLRLEFDATAETLGKTAAVMTDDLNGWRSIYALKRITLPA